MGDKNVGKTALMNYFGLVDRYEQKTAYAYEFARCYRTYHNKRIKLIIFEHHTPSDRAYTYWNHLKDLNGVIFLYNVCSKESLHSLRTYMDQLNSTMQSNAEYRRWRG